MQHTVVALLLSTFFGASALAAPVSPESLPLNAVVTLSSRTHQGCGSGFIDPHGRIVTNAHLVHSLCPGYNCAGLEVRSAPALDAPGLPRALPTTPRVAAVWPALDLGVIEAGLPPTGLPIGERAKSGDSVTTLGFPGCGKLELSSGTVVTTDPLHLVTTTRGSHGSSGSPIFNEAGAIIGVVDEASTFLDALGRGPFSLRGVHIDPTILSAAPHDLPLQFERLAAFRETVLPRSLPDRVRGVFDLVAALDGIIRATPRSAIPAELAPLFERSDEILDGAPPLLTASASLHAESLFVDRALQNRSSFTVSAALDAYRTAVEKSGRSTAHLPASPLVPTVFDLQVAVILGFAICVALTVVFLVRGIRLLRRRWAR